MSVNAMYAVKPTIFTGITSISERFGIRVKNGDVGATSA